MIFTLREYSGISDVLSEAGSVILIAIALITFFLLDDDVQLAAANNSFDDASTTPARGQAQTACGVPSAGDR